MAGVTLLDQYGNEMPPAAPKPRVVGGGPRPQALGGSAQIPYDAADIYGPQMAAWRPYLWSPDAETAWGQRDRIVARARDTVRNDGWAYGGITKILDTQVGANFRPVSKPDYRALQVITANKAFDAKWADEFGHAVDAYWRMWATDTGKYCDGMRSLGVSQLLWVGMRHKLIDGDALSVMLWQPELLGEGKARYATSVQLIDPDRLSNPQYRFDTQTMRGGVEINPKGAPVGYWIRRAHQGDWFSAAQSMTWDYLDKETAWGRPIVVHDYDHERAGQHHGGVGVLTSILQRLKMLVGYDKAELEAAIINAIFSAYVKSPYDPEMVREALESDKPAEAALGMYQDQRNGFWKDRGDFMIGGVKISQLFPGEEIGSTTANRPSGSFEPFEVAVLRHVATGIGCTYEQLTGDFSRTNYSSFRGATNEALKTYNRRAQSFIDGFAMQIRVAILEEIFEVEDLPLPRNAPSFEAARTAYAAAMWLRPGRGWTNPLDEIRASSLSVQSSLSTLEIEAAEQGLDLDEVIDQRKIEIQKFKDAGIELPLVYQGPASPNPDNVQAPGGAIGSGG